MRVLPVRGLVAVLAVGAVLLSGCSAEEPANDTLPTATSSAEATPTLEPLGPADFPVPNEAREQTAAGIVAFATYYLDLADYLLPSLDSQPLRDLSADCESCNQLADGYDADRAAGNSYRGGDLTITSTGTPTVETGRGDVSILLEQSASSVFDANGEAIGDRSLPLIQLSGGMAFNWNPGLQCWLVTQLTIDRI